MLSSNLKIYNKNTKFLKTINKDFLQVEPFTTDVVILCPPWGGINLNEYTYKDLDLLITPKLSLILEHASKFSQNMILQLPKTTSIHSIVEIVVRCASLRPIFTVEKIWRNQNELDQYFVYLGEPKFTKISSEFYQMIYNDLGVGKKAKKRKQMIRRNL